MTEVQCPAKINLYLRVVGRRMDGFHELETVFQTIDLCDILSWEPNLRPWRFTLVDGPDLDSDNLVTRAAVAYTKLAGLPLRGHAQLVKRIPIGGGLGGGSSDAAGMLTLMNNQYQMLNDRELGDLAISLGSDVPFFLVNGCQWGRGRGERLTKCDWQIPVKRGFLLVPPFSIATPSVFRALNAPTLGKPSPLVPLPPIGVLGQNDLLAPAFSVAPELKLLFCEFMALLPNQDLFMSGSGSTLVWLTEKKGPPPQLASLSRFHKVGILPFQFK